ncbi:MAG: hypothetical protein ACR2LN_07625 [Candidatus Levyibacteriota bacterium]
MSPEARHKEIVGLHERHLLQVVTKHEVPLLQGLWDRWGDQILPNGQKRGWLLCGPGTIAQSRIINWETGIPIFKDGNPYTQEYLQLGETYLYYPEDGNMPDGVEHTVVSYFNGQGQVIIIDPTGPLLWGESELIGANDLQGAISIQKFPVSKFEKALRDNYHLQPLDPADEKVKKAYNKYGYQPPDQTRLADWKSAFNDNRITGPFPFRGDSGQEIIGDTGRYGVTLATFIRTIIPDWAGIR